MDLSSISDGKWLAGRIPEQNFAHRCLGVFTLSPDMEKLEKYSDKDLVVKSKKLFGAFGSHLTEVTKRTIWNEKKASTEQTEVCWREKLGKRRKGKCGKKRRKCLF